jgi:hypothetical protein
MQWEIVVALILAIGICTAVLEAREKRAARRREAKEPGAEQYPAKEASKKQNS